ncbi:MmgE/PrpD family protein [Pseudonocardia sp. GCM10023141]|uniref:MmgE/PrpD family protein n=1 Tax=Pseudonocardia sp. GCM10023141 TaxID=3252653 RepID=UPI0036071EE6
METSTGSLLTTAALRAGDRAAELVEPATVLLADHLACLLARAVGEGRPAGGVRATPWEQDGTLGLVASWAIRAHALDMDDINWSTLTHPGSIVWPVVLALGAESSAPAETLLRAAAAGYEMVTAVASVIAPVHGPRLHATATSGGAGAAVAAAVLLDLGPEHVTAAVSHALSMSGGAGQATLERSGTTAFHRAVAATTGVLAARAAQRGLTASLSSLDGPRGLLAMWGGSGPVELPDSPGGLATTSIRPYPVSGFLQTVVAVVVAARAAATGRVRSITVRAASVVLDLTRDSGDPRWSLVDVVAAAWDSADPYAAADGPAYSRAALRGLISAEPDGRSVWAAGVEVVTENERIVRESSDPPGLHPTVAQVQRKWEHLGAGDPADPCGWAGDLLTGRAAVTEMVRDGRW